MATLTPSDERKLLYSGPLFSSFPYLMVRLARGLYHICLLRADRSTTELVRLADYQAVANKVPVVLAVRPDLCGYFDPTGLKETYRDVPRPTFVTYGSLKTVQDRHELAESEERICALEEYACRLNPPGETPCGDSTESSRDATPEDVARLGGEVIDRIPPGLHLCPRCDMWKGEYLYCVERQEKVAPVSCRCDNDTWCARCGHNLAPGKLNSYFFDTKQRRVYYMPGLEALKHKCADEPVRTQ